LYPIVFSMAEKPKVCLFLWNIDDVDFLAFLVSPPAWHRQAMSGSQTPWAEEFGRGKEGS
jgi:hypothetical protein